MELHHYSEHRIKMYMLFFNNSLGCFEKGSMPITAHSPHKENHRLEFRFANPCTPLVGWFGILAVKPYIAS
ncbi:MAG: hypothetical protein HW390_3280 [Candidatus Brocadiaceae bacterium]|nr:hypothetical protein [Candidatus Brocadiaceae bacterium]